jgi:hypothetical protein
MRFASFRLRDTCAAALALVCLLPLAACSSQSRQIPAGTSAALGSPNPPEAPQGQMLNNALSKDTRQTLQDAMNSAN